jgi:hypothetical protein
VTAARPSSLRGIRPPRLVQEGGEEDRTDLREENDEREAVSKDAPTGEPAWNAERRATAAIPENASEGLGRIG